MQVIVALNSRTIRTSRGIGLELVRQILAVPSNFVIATCRTPDKATALHALKESAKGTLHVLPLDTSDKASTDAVVKPVEELLGSRGLDYLINNAAMVRTFLDISYFVRC